MVALFITPVLVIYEKICQVFADVVPISQEHRLPAIKVFYFLVEILTRRLLPCMEDNGFKDNW